MARLSLRRGRRAAAAMVVGLGTASGGVLLALAAPAGTAYADSAPYELYCPGTPVGNIVLNDAVTTGTITPAAPAAGGSFTLTNYQTKVSLPTAIVSAAAALGNSAIMGSATTTIDATGATPATMASPPITFSEPIPSPVPATGLALMLPGSPGSVGPFTASSGAITMKQDTSAKLTLTVSGSPLALTCTSYTNNTITPTGITTQTPPTSASLSPTIATAGAGATTTPTTPTTAPASTPTTAPASTPTTAPVSTPAATAMTGAGPGVWLLGAAGGALLCLGLASLSMSDGPRSLRRRLRSAGAEAAGSGPLWVDSPGAEGSHGLWIDGEEPGHRA